MKVGKQVCCLCGSSNLQSPPLLIDEWKVFDLCFQKLGSWNCCGLLDSASFITSRTVLRKCGLPLRSPGSSSDLFVCLAAL